METITIRGNHSSDEISSVPHEAINSRTDTKRRRVRPKKVRLWEAAGATPEGFSDDRIPSGSSRRATVRPSRCRSGESGRRGSTPAPPRPEPGRFPIFGRAQVRKTMGFIGNGVRIPGFSVTATSSASGARARPRRRISGWGCSRQAIAEMISCLPKIGI